MALSALAAAAQSGVNLDVYDGAQLTTGDLNGTARYVGMGGAMEALGADISTISTNPAGIGMFRSTQASLSLGMVIQGGGSSFYDGKPVNPSFDQVGVVFSKRTGLQNFLNFGFNFHKSRNFDYVLSAAAGAVNGSSQNRQTTIKGVRGDLDTYWGESQVDKLYGDLLSDKDGQMYDIDATQYDFNRAHTGYIGDYDFNISGNINNRVYLGLTIGIKDVHYSGYSEYFETLSPLTATAPTSVLMSDDHTISGTGYDIKAGAIFRPIEESPLRFGVSVATPTWYRLKTSNTTRLGNVLQNGYDANFRFNTPWKFGASVGYTIGTEWALGLSYEYADYTSNDMRAISESGYDWDGYYYESSESDRELKRSTQLTLRGVSTLKMGAEYKPVKALSLRVGYNYVSPMFQKGGQRDQTLNSSAVYMASTTDYTNWYATNRLTAGVGYTMGKLRLDLAYQCSLREGDFYPYMNGLSAGWVDDSGQMHTLTNECSPVSVKDTRHQLLLTANYTF